MVDWQRDAKFYQFWTNGSVDGSFMLDKVRPGHYTLHAFTDGVLGEYIKTDIIVEAGLQSAAAYLRPSVQEPVPHVRGPVFHRKPTVLHR